MNKTAIKNFAIWARNKLIADICYRAGLMGITEKGIADALPQSTREAEFYDFGATEPYLVAGEAIKQRRQLVSAIREKEVDTDYATAYQYIMEEVAYTWFNRLIAVRFMEVNDYLPSHLRALSSESGKVEPDLVTTPFDAELPFTAEEEAQIIQWKQDNKLDELFRFLFIKQCNALNEILPGLFEKTTDYTEVLLNLSVVDQEGVVYKLTHDIPEKDFNIEQGGQVEIIGWLYQYYNTEPKAAAFAKNGKITKEEIPAVTQLFTPDWIVRYMVENSLGRLWLEGHPNAELRGGWKYYLDEADQEPEVEAQLAKLREEYKTIKPEEIKVIDPCMGSGHILVYAFDVLMQIYTSAGWDQREAAQSILKNNLFGLDIDDRAAQLAYFAVMMKARQYDRRLLTRGIQPNIHSIIESNALGGAYKLAMGDFLLSKEHQETLNYLLDAFIDAKEYGSILCLEKRDYVGLLRAWNLTASQTTENLNLTLWFAAVEHEIPKLIEQAIILTQGYDVVVTNPPYMAVSNAGAKVNDYVKKNFPDSKADLFAVFIERCGQMAKKNGYQAMITQHAWMFLSSFEKLRTKLLAVDIVNMAHLGARAFEEIGGEVVQTTSFVIRKSHIADYKGEYCRLIEPTSQQGKEDMFLAGENRYAADQSNFSKIPGSPVAYWLSLQTVDAFKAKKLYEVFEARNGITTGQNDLFIRYWYEVVPKSDKWFKCNKGGSFRRWYGNQEYVIDWENDGFRLKNFRDERGKQRSTLRSIEFNFAQAITMSRIGSGITSFRFLPNGFITEGASNNIYFKENWENLLAFLNSKVCDFILELYNPTINVMPDDLRNLPLTYLQASICCNHQVNKAVMLSKTDWDSYETSWDFKRNPLV